MESNQKLQVRQLPFTRLRSSEMMVTNPGLVQLFFFSHGNDSGLIQRDIDPP